jgi:hypothetical protein
VKQDDEDFSFKEHEIGKALYDSLKWLEIAPVRITVAAQNNEESEKGTLKLKAIIKWDKNRIIVKHRLEKFSSFWGVYHGG